MGGLTVLLHFHGKSVSGNTLARMTEQVAYRGYNGIKYYVDSQIGLSSLALHTTLEAEQDRQPLVSADGRYVVVADSRIDNRQELLSKLFNTSHHDKVIGDAALILAGWERWHSDLPSHLLGDFAFAIWDNQQKSLFAARDPLGVCSLYFSQFDGVFCLATEAQQILQHPDCSRRLNRRVLADWIVGSVDPDTSIFHGISPLPAAHYLIVNRGDIRISRFWDINPAKQIRYNKISDYAEHFRELLGQCVSDRLRSNAGVIGSEMSGGMDSTTITGLALENLPPNNSLKAFSFYYPTLSGCDESDYIRAMTDHLHLDTTLINAERFGAMAYPDQFPPSLESPGTKYDPVYQALIDALIPTGARVLLTGNGGDEMTWGNGLIYGHRMWRGDPRGLSDLYRVSRYYGVSFWKLFRSLCVSPYLSPSVKRAYRRMVSGRSDVLPVWFSREAADKLGMLDDDEPHSPDFNNAPHQQMYITLTQGSMRTVVDRGDLLAMSSGISPRHPFLDRRVAEFMFAVPLNLWTRGIYAKWLMRQATAGILPDSVRWRKDKTIFSSFYTYDIARHPEKYIKRLKDFEHGWQGLVDSDYLVKWFSEQHRNNPERAAWNIVMLLQVRDWCIAHKDSLDLNY